MAQNNPGCLGFLFSWLTGPPPGRGGVPAVQPTPAGLPYRVRDDFLSPAEASFFRVLATAAAPEYIVCPKVALRDLFFVCQGGERQAHQNRIAHKHVDFVLCDATTLRPAAGVELDDASHRRRDRMERDAFVEAVFAAARLPLVRIPVQAGYQIAAVRSELDAALPAGAPPIPAAPLTPSAGPPVCASCATPMVLRTATRGQQQGQQFYGCANYPKCRHRVALAVPATP